MFSRIVKLQTALVAILAGLMSFSAIGILGLCIGCKPRAPRDAARAPETNPAKEETANNKPEDVPPPVDDDEKFQRLIREAAGPNAHLVTDSLATDNKKMFIKENTLFVLSLKSESRRWYFLTYFIGIIDDAQLAEMTRIIDSYNDQYEDLLERRAAILENARDGDKTAQLLRYNQIATFKLSSDIRNRLIHDILTLEQKKLYAAQFEGPRGIPAPRGEK